MRKVLLAAAMVLAAASLGACRKGADSNQLTAEENAQLDDANNMLDASPDGLAVTNAPMGNGDVASDSVDDDE
ncbi:MAG: hypothetical protein ACJ8EB_03285, partial [Allosphingosinicella sp.]